MYCLTVKFVAPSRGICKYLWGSRITLCKCVVCSFAQPSWRTRNWTIVISMRKFYCAPGPKLEKWRDLRRSSEQKYPGCQRYFFSLGAIELSGEAAEASREATRKNLWHQRITTSLPCRRQFPLIDIRSQSLF